jgi:hypothetical protein
MSLSFLQVMQMPTSFVMRGVGSELVNSSNKLSNESITNVDGNDDGHALWGSDLR